MELKPNMYYRTYSGFINKIISIKDYNEREYLLNGFYINKKDTIKKASYNIIDLIEVGDYVDGEQVRYIEEDTDYRILAIDEDYTYIIAGYDCDGFTKPIKSIVTKEQFENMEYRIGE